MWDFTIFDMVLYKIVIILCRYLLEDESNKVGKATQLFLIDF